ncbi:hypothetical protein B0T17DRAFT_614400 [Bombardia bombarda]|uniref:Uncharacterized protein n=1 Tax=Bombardia bombarda TaxID=252184 RepID=A0AA40C8U4_9PEZI|nr:hypothetical protein B0T17DRAFT_614400 [Bombardia bombarda]
MSDVEMAENDFVEPRSGGNKNRRRRRRHRRHENKSPPHHSAAYRPQQPAAESTAARAGAAQHPNVATILNRLENLHLSPHGTWDARSSQMDMGSNQPNLNVVDSRPPAGPNMATICANCGLPGHELYMCVAACPEGDIPGCARCNSVTHTLGAGGCVGLAGFVLQYGTLEDPGASNELWRRLVVCRGGKAQIRTGKTQWVFPQLIRQRLQQGGNVELQRFPLSRPFTKDYMRQHPNYWRTHDYTMEPHNLPIDLRTSSSQRILDDARLNVPYQSPEERVRYKLAKGYKVSLPL